ncbi:cobalamin adenosyltransferase [Proteinivorax hydrogeniformans]|uniref:Cobalamin adenosyltransferase n=1 Tax=Proteinivorax hydrogeniformans TaxID=1826727 RepID=A0AAU8HUB4_9FIRM
MKFITEKKLRDFYIKDSLDTFELSAGERLTPGGRQFLLDRGIKIVDQFSKRKKKAKPTKNEKTVTKTNQDKMLHLKVKSVQALFFQTAQELLNKDVILAQKVIDLSKHLPQLSDDKGDKPHLSIDNKDCPAINKDNFSDHLGDCIEITEFHIQLEKGREIIALHRLRCALRELEQYALELFENGEQKQGVICSINQITNTLSQTICSIVGGTKCQR